MKNHLHIATYKMLQLKIPNILRIMLYQFNILLFV